MKIQNFMKKYKKIGIINVKKKKVPIRLKTFFNK